MPPQHSSRTASQVDSGQALDFFGSILMLDHEEEPVAAAGHIAAETSLAVDIHHDILRQPVRRNAAHRHVTRFVQLRGDDAGRSVDPMQTGVQPAEVRQR
jgi:hypothetical protein